MLRLKRERLNSQRPASASKASCGLDKAGQKLAEVLKLTATSKQQPKGIKAEPPSPSS